MSIPNLASHKLTPSPGQNTTPTRRLPANPEAYSTAVYLRGDDIFVPVCLATAFGGPMDRGDDGSTASGVFTNRPGGIIGCALPMPADRYCMGTPLPQLPWKTIVQVTLRNRMVPVPVLDEGPGRGLKSGAFIDLTLEAWEALLGTKLAPEKVNSQNGMVTLLIPGVGKYCVDYWPQGVPRPEEEGGA